MREWKFKGKNYKDDYSMYRDAVDRYCRSSKCPFWYSEIGECMTDVEGVNEKIGIENRKCTIDMWC